MISTKRFEQMVEQIAPLDFQYEWDNSGWNILVHDEVDNVLTCLDVTMDIVDEAIEGGYDTILSHHPMMFHAVKNLDKADPVTGIVLKAAAAGINVYCSHTACDCAPMGLNLALANRLGMIEPKFFINEGEGYGLGFIGDIQPTDAQALLQMIKGELGARRLKYAPHDGNITRIAAIGGSAGEFFKEAKEQGAQALIVGDAKYNDFLDAAAMDVMLIEAGHFETEVGFAILMRDSLQNKINELKYKLTVNASGRMKPPYEAI